MKELDTNTFNRLSLSLIEKDGLDPDAAIKKLESLQLDLICGEAIRKSIPLQSALLTAVNTAKRSFLGGVNVIIPDSVDSLLPWSDNKNLAAILAELGATIAPEPRNGVFGICFGLPATIDENRIQVVCNDWQAGILVDMELDQLSEGSNIPTAGVFGGAWSVFLAFLRASGILLSSCDRSTGISLWRPDLQWLDDRSKGPVVKYLPAKYWILGLGHLGQAYCWNIGLLPYPNPKSVSIMLQDDDRLVKANISAGLLSEDGQSGFKTRRCSAWLEQRNFETKITERRFDEWTKRVGEEPYLAFCGFDNAPSRRHLEKTGFDLVLEAGLGGRLGTFDRISFHSFPNARQTPEQIWHDANGENDTEFSEKVHNVLQGFQDSNSEECGIIPLTIAGKSVSASFVGACTGAMMLAESIRALHGGKRYDKINLHLRDINSRSAIIHSCDTYSTELVRNSYEQI